MPQSPAVFARYKRLLSDLKREHVPDQDYRKNHRHEPYRDIERLTKKIPSRLKENTRLPFKAIGYEGKLIFVPTAMILGVHS